MVGILEIVPSTTVESLAVELFSVDTRFSLQQTRESPRLVGV